MLRRRIIMRSAVRWVIMVVDGAAASASGAGLVMK